MPIIFFIFIFGMIILGVVALIGDTSENEKTNYKYTSISNEVLKYRNLVEQYCNKYEIADQVDIVLAIMMQESGGRGLDPMQASESGFNIKYPRIPNGITDPIYSIEVGIQNWASVFKEAGELKLALQGYNFGNGYIAWAKDKGGYTLENAKEFSSMMSSRLGWSSYGDILYVNHVMRYITPIQFGDDTFKNMMIEALKYQGYPYVFGGTTPETSFDCSGLTKWVYNKIGVELPRTAQQQYDVMSHIGLDESKPGDLLFFTRTYDTTDYITHVGIFIDNNTMYHAGDPIGYTDFNDSYWQERFICAGRMK